ncbi:major facilitator superfamily domain-containing protein 4B-like isoform X2 [Argopecten irradians]|uniref:major facilitator superfamily domain-containing protein 4B-like isoform X2 n=1 Tax=Argopecten irradians TaxID=31199 RepID=UPI003715A6DB
MVIVSIMEENSQSTKEIDNQEEDLEMVQLNSLCHEDDSMSTVNDGKSSVRLESCEVIHSHTRTDHRFRELLIYTICLYIAKFTQGWSQALFGPSYIDLRMISSADLASGSWILTSRFIGSTIGSTIQGVLAGRWNSKLVFGSSMIGSCIAFAVIPWCSNLTAMITGHVVLGVVLGIYASVL